MIVNNDELRAGWLAAIQRLQDAHDQELAQAQHERRLVKVGRIKMLRTAIKILENDKP